MPRSALCCTLAASASAAFAVYGQRTGLALSVTALLAVAAVVLAVRGGPDGERIVLPAPVALAVALALAPMFRDAGWVVSICLVAAALATATAVVPVRAWGQVRTVLFAPLQLIGGTVFLARAAHAAAPRPGGGLDRGLAVARGIAAALVLAVCFGALFTAADPAFADAAGELFGVDVGLDGGVERALLALFTLALVGGLVGSAQAAPPLSGPTGWRPPQLELTIVLGALVAVFTAFVMVQLQVLFGGATYVQQTTGLGYGEYARKGFGPLLVVCALTLALVGLAARRRERAVRGLLGGLCLLTLVVLGSAHHRLGLVEDAYGFTRTRFAGHVVVLWLGALFVAILAAGAERRVADRLPGLVLPATLLFVLGLALANPDGRIAASAVERFERTGELDEDALAELSADAAGPIRRLPADRRHVRSELSSRLERPDGLLGLNLARARAR